MNAIVNLQTCTLLKHLMLLSVIIIIAVYYAENWEAISYHIINLFSLVCKLNYISHMK